MDYSFTILTNSILGFNMKSWFFLIQNHWKGISFTTSQTLCVQGDRGYCSFVCYNTSLLYRRSFGSPSKKRVKLNVTNFFLFFEGEMFRLLKKLLRFKFITYSYIIACVLRRDCNPLQFYSDIYNSGFLSSAALPVSSSTVTAESPRIWTRSVGCWIM